MVHNTLLVLWKIQSILFYILKNENCCFISYWIQISTEINFLYWFLVSIKYPLFNQKTVAITAFRQTWKSQGILFEANYFNFAQILIGVNLVFCVILNYGRTYILLNYGRIYYSEHCFLSVLLAVHVYLLCSKCCK